MSALVGAEVCRNCKWMVEVEAPTESGTEFICRRFPPSGCLLLGIGPGGAPVPMGKAAVHPPVQPDATTCGEFSRKLIIQDNKRLPAELQS